MKKQFITLTAVCAACVALSAQAQNSSSTSAGSTGASTDQSTGQQGTGQQGFDSTRHYGSAGRMGHQEVRVSKLMGSEVKDNRGQNIGTINDVIINPASGRVDFAVVSLGSTVGSSSSDNTSIGTPSTPPSTTSATSSSSSSSGKQVPVPWVLLRSSAASSATVGSTIGGQQSFVFNGDTMKLQSAPSFDQSTDISQFSWRQSVYGHFGMTPGSATGGASSPGGTESSTGGSSSQTPPSPDLSNPSK